MSGNRLLDALTSSNPAELDRVFGREYELNVSPAMANLDAVKRVAIFTESFFPKIDGVSKSAYLTLRYLQKTGREVLVFAPDIAPEHVGQSRIVLNPSFSLPFAPETRLAFPHWSVSRSLQDFKPDMIHLFSPVILSAAGMMYGQRHRIPVIGNYQTDLPAYSKHYGFGYFTPVVSNWLRYVHNGCHLTLVPAQSISHQLEEQGYQRLRIWRRGVDLNRFNPAHRTEEMRARLLNGRDPDSLLCLYVGRLATEKRIDLLLEIARLPGVALTVVGDGATREELETLFADTDAYFTGYLFGDELSHAYASADAFAFPGPAETFGQVVQEAMASGLPCIIINQGGIVDLVEHGTDGFICPDDPFAFAEAARTLRDTPTLRHVMAANARAKAMQHPWEAIMQQLEGYYTEAVDIAQRFRQMAGPLTQWRWTADQFN